MPSRKNTYHTSTHTALHTTHATYTYIIRTKLEIESLYNPSSISPEKSGGDQM